jgi:hypothetical protein
MADALAGDMPPRQPAQFIVDSGTSRSSAA